jgi:hypothetical protein
MLVLGLGTEPNRIITRYAGPALGAGTMLFDMKHTTTVHEVSVGGVSGIFRVGGCGTAPKFIATIRLSSSPSRQAPVAASNALRPTHPHHLHGAILGGRTRTDLKSLKVVADVRPDCLAQAGVKGNTDGLSYSPNTFMPTSPP